MPCAWVTSDDHLTAAASCSTYPEDAHAVVIVVVGADAAVAADVVDGGDVPGADEDAAADDDEAEDAAGDEDEGDVIKLRNFP